MFYKLVSIAGVVMFLLAIGGAEGTMNLADCVLIGTAGAVSMVYGFNKLGLFEE